MGRTSKLPTEGVRAKLKKYSHSKPDHGCYFLPFVFSAIVMPGTPVNTEQEISFLVLANSREIHPEPEKRTILHTEHVTMTTISRVKVCVCKDAATREAGTGTTIQ